MCRACFRDDNLLLFLVNQDPAKPLDRQPFTQPPEIRKVTKPRVTNPFLKHSLRKVPIHGIVIYLLLFNIQNHHNNLCILPLSSISPAYTIHHSNFTLVCFESYQSTVKQSNSQLVNQKSSPSFPTTTPPDNLQKQPPSWEKQGASPASSPPWP